MKKLIILVFLLTGCSDFSKIERTARNFSTKDENIGSVVVSGYSWEDTQYNAKYGCKAVINEYLELWEIQLDLKWTIRKNKIINDYPPQERKFFVYDCVLERN